MRQPYRLCLIAVLLALAACSPAPSGKDVDKDVESGSPVTTAVRDANAELQRIRVQGDDKTAREITSLEYPAYRELMKFSGLDAEQGGEAQADAALRALFALYERKVQSFESDLPEMLKMADSGDNIGYSGFAASFITGMLQGDAAVTLWEQQQRDGKPDGKFSQSSEGSSIEMEWSGSHSSSASEFEGTLPGGLAGKIRTKVDIDTCPDASGKINVKFTSDSQLHSTANPGTGGSIKVTAELAKYLDDDAHLIDGQMDSDLHVEQSAFGNGGGSFVDLTQTLSTTRGETGTKVNRRSQAATDTDVQAAESVAKLGMLAAMAAMDKAKQAWEGGQCIDLKVTSDPGKRKGIKPNTAFDIEAKPRAKSDGAPAGGTVTATLSGGASLQPASGKVKADAKYQYAGPEKKDESASIAFESRSKRGVGKATLEFSTGQKAYRLVGIGSCNATGDVCDLAQPFTAKGCVTVDHTPTSDRAGTLAYSGQGISGKGSYTIAGSGDELMMSTTSTACFMGKCRAAKSQARLTRIDSCP